MSKPEGKNRHGEELVGAIRGRNPEDRTYLNFDTVETVGTSDEIPVLVLPAHKRIEFQLASADVVHSFWMVDFLFKRDVMPDPEANHSDKPSRSPRSRRRALSSAAAPNSAAPITR